MFTESHFCVVFDGKNESSKLIAQSSGTKAPYNAESSVIDSRGSSAGEYFVEDGLFNVQDTAGSKANSEYIVRTQNTNNYPGLQRLVETSRIITDESPTKRSVNQHSEDKELVVPNTSNQGWDAKFSAKKEIYGDDDDEVSGQDGSGDSLNFHDTVYQESFLSKDHAHHKFTKDRHAHQKNKFSDRADVGGAGLLWSLVVIAFVLAVVSMVFLTRWCCHGKTPDVELKSVKLEKSSKLRSSDQSPLKESRIRVGKRKSQENRKVLRKLSADQGASTVNEELAIACSVISPTIETRKKNSGALHTRACIRAATSHSRRNSSFQEDLEKARCEFVNAPARFAKLVSLAGDEKETEAMQDSDSEVVKTRDSPVVINLQ